MSNVFISYSRESLDVVTKLARDIEALGRNAWFDEDLTGGHVWWDEILARIRDTEVFVFALTPDSLDSTACDRECDYAVKLGIPVLPVLVADGVSVNLLPPSLAAIQFVDYRNSDRDSVLRLARAFSSLPPPTRLSGPLPDPPEVPTSYLGDLAERVSSAEPLSFEEQSAVLVDIKTSLRNTENTADAKTVLRRFRERRDLLATIASEIDQIVFKNGSKPTPQANHDLNPTVIRKHKMWLRPTLFLVVFAILGLMFGMFLGGLSTSRFINGKTVVRVLSGDTALAVAVISGLVAFLSAVIGDWISRKRRWIGVAFCTVGFAALGFWVAVILSEYRVRGDGDLIGAMIVWAVGAIAAGTVAYLNRKPVTVKSN